MAIHFTTNDAKSLLQAFNARISQADPKGKITTWVKSDDDKYYTHKAPEWNKLAWFLPKIEADKLTFNIIKPKNKDISATAYAYYHGHLLETFLNHFDNSFQNGAASAMPEVGDIIQS
jgi:hypothetical protein